MYITLGFFFLFLHNILPAPDVFTGIKRKKSGRILAIFRFRHYITFVFIKVYFRHSLKLKKLNPEVIHEAAKNFQIHHQP